MALKVSKEDVWAASMVDRAGALAEKLDVLSEAGADIEFLIARRAPDKPRTGVVFLTPLKGAAQVKAAKAAGFKKTKSLHSVKVEGHNKAGLGAKLTQALAAKGISLRGVSAAVIGNKFVAHFAFKKAADSAKAIRILRKL